MIKRHAALLLFCLVCLPAVSAQVPVNIQIQIVKAEDARRYDKALEDLLRSPVPAIRDRAALAAGRIGDDRAIPELVVLLNNGGSSGAMAAFALGEIESIKAADAILRAITSSQGQTRARLVEAAGKIAAANPKDEKSKALGTAVLHVLDAELKKPSAPNTAVIRLALTAVLRARPAGAEDVIRPVLAFTDPNIVADALNTLARLKAKGANRDARDLLETNLNAIVRANAARVLGAAEDESAVDILTRAAVGDADSRVRISAIRSLAAIKDPTPADKLLQRAEMLLVAYKRSTFRNPSKKSEMIELATTLGRILPDTRNERAVNFLREFAALDNGFTPDIAIARLRIAPGRGDDTKGKDLTNWHQYSTLGQIVGEFATLETKNEQALKMKAEAPGILLPLAKAFAVADPQAEPNILAGPDVLTAYSQFKTDDLAEVLRQALQNKDIFIRATAAGLMADQKPSPENLDALNAAFDYGFQNDIQYDDAVLAALDALFKLDKRKALSALAVASGSPDHLVRKKALELLKDDAYKQVDLLPAALKYADEHRLNQVRPYSGKGTKMGQLLNSDADYRRALSRRNGTVKATVNTEKGSFTIDLLPEDAPLTVDNFVKLARSGYYNGLEVHRVVPNFVMQDGDPRGDGNGGPGWSIRCEINMVPYERGAVGMALSGKDTGGSQWFVTHSPQPHLDGGYTVFGKVNDAGMKVVDNIVRGDKILSVNIVEGAATRRRAKRR